MGAITPGLVSITFRSMKAQDLIALIVRAGQHVVEWGGDIHVPHGNLTRAREVRSMCADAGISTPSYGSYFRLGKSAAEGLAFEQVLATAVELNAQTVRIWAGAQGSLETDQRQRAALVEEARQCAERAADADVTVSLEYHGGTLTDTDASTQSFLAEVDHPAIRSYWQPRNASTPEDNLAGLSGVAAFLSNLHVFHWHDFQNRMPLAEGADAWSSYLSRAATIPGDRYALLEFTRDDDPEQYVADAGTLAELLAGGRAPASTRV